MYRGFTKDESGQVTWCPLCNSSCHQIPEDRRVIHVICQCCGEFCCSIEARSIFESLRHADPSPGYKLSYVFRSFSEHDFERGNPDDFPMFKCADLERFLATPDPATTEKLEMLLRFLASLSRYPGQRISFHLATDYSVLCGKNAAEGEFFIDALAEAGSIITSKLGALGLECVVSSSGWQELERAQQSGADSPNGFIAMWFDSSQDATRESIKSAITAAGYRPIRIDEVEHTNKIDDEILAKIRQSRFLVADFTGQRHGVYFEAGFMLGLGRTVIWICNKSDFDKVHFDTRQYNTIVYDKTDELKSRLQFRIEAILGKGPIPA